MRNLKYYILIFLLVSTFNVAVAKENIEKELWYTYAKDWDIARENMEKNDKEKKGTFAEDYNLLRELRLLLAQSPSPTQETLKRLLQSSNDSDKKVALINIFIKKIYFKDLYNEIINCLRSEQAFIVRFYCYECFDCLETIKLEYHTNDFLSAVENESNEELILNVLPVLIKIDSKRTINLFVKYLQSGSNDLKTVVRIYLEKMDEEKKEKIKKIISGRKRGG
ncbi:MAG: hypothetical protein KJN62_00750 [Deltaproteobacteria bacterium]|nr:hypothetical protein [Deltaproteobacteria bacterium]